MLLFLLLIDIVVAVAAIAVFSLGGIIDVGVGAIVVVAVNVVMIISSWRCILRRLSR